jgi:hypothetical protein
MNKESKFYIQKRERKERKRKERKRNERKQKDKNLTLYYLCLFPSHMLPFL